MKKQLNIKKLILLNLPYILMGLFSTNFGEAWRMAVGADASAKMLSFFSTLPVALASWWPSLHPLDLLVGLCCCGGLRLAVYLKSKNAKKYRHGMEYGSARWGTHEDITPYIDPVFQNNVILTKTESLTMNSRPKDPKTARNKNVLVIGGSGSGKTRFWLKPNLMQMHSSYVVTDPKGTILVECGKMLQRGAPKLGKDGKPMKDKHGKVIYEPYRIKVLNTINFKKSIREVENIFENSDFVYMLNQAGGDRQILAKQLGISTHQLSYVTHSGEGEGLLFYGSTILPFVDHFPKNTELYRIMTTKPQELKKKEDE